MITKFGTLLAANGAYVKWQSSKRFMDAHFICYTLALRNTHVFCSLSTFRRHFIPYVGYSFCMFIVCHIGLFVCTFSSRWLFRTLARRIPMRLGTSEEKNCLPCVIWMHWIHSSNSIEQYFPHFISSRSTFRIISSSCLTFFQSFFFIVSFKLVYLMWSSFLALFYLPLLIKICIYVHRPWEFVVYTLNDNTKLKCSGTQEYLEWNEALLIFTKVHSISYVIIYIFFFLIWQWVYKRGKINRIHYREERKRE